MNSRSLKRLHKLKMLGVVEFRGADDGTGLIDVKIKEFEDNVMDFSWLSGYVRDLRLEIKSGAKDLYITLPDSKRAVKIIGNNLEFKRLEVEGCSSLVIVSDDSIMAGEVVIRCSTYSLDLESDILMKGVTFSDCDITIISDMCVPKVCMIMCKSIINNLIYVDLSEYSYSNKSLDLELNSCDISVRGEVRVVDSVRDVSCRENLSSGAIPRKLDKYRYTIEYDSEYNGTLKVRQIKESIKLGRKETMNLNVTEITEGKIENSYGDFYGVDITKVKGDLAICNISMASKEKLSLNRIANTKHVSKELVEIFNRYRSIEFELGIDYRDIEYMISENVKDLHYIVKSKWLPNFVSKIIENNRDKAVVENITVYSYLIDNIKDEWEDMEVVKFKRDLQSGKIRYLRSK